jgi:hypothetical protein
VLDLRIGASILREALQTVGKEEDEGLKVKIAKAEEEIRIKRVCAPFLLAAKRKSFLGFSRVFIGKGSIPGGS